MPFYTYSAARREGGVEKGVRDADNKRVLAQVLRAEGRLLLDAKERGMGVGERARGTLDDFFAWIRPISLVERMFFARNLSVMVGAGLSLTRALDALSDETTNPKFKRIIADVNSSVVKGKPFAEALQSHQRIFGELFVNMVEVGETTGKLHLVLKLIANQMKRDHTLRKRVRGAMVYPAIIIMALAGVGTMMMIYVIPTLTATIKDLGVPLPLTTRIIIGISEALVQYGLWIATTVVGLVALAWRLHRTSWGRAYFDRFLLRLPLFGSLIRRFNTARFCRTLAYLTTAGVPIVRSLEITAGVLGNTSFRVVIRNAAVEIQRGKQLHLLFANHPDIFQPLVIQMVSVGEETGKLSEMLLRLALFLEEEVTSATKDLSTVIEPLLMIIVGTVVGFFAVSMMQPIYSTVGAL